MINLPPNRDPPLHLTTTDRDSLTVERVAQKAAEITGKPEIERKFIEESIDLVRMQTVMHPAPCRIYKSALGFVTSYARQFVLTKLITEDELIDKLGVTSLGHRYDSLPCCTSSH
jgi:hypothetical protein